MIEKKKLDIFSKYKEFFNDFTADKIMNKKVKYLKNENTINDAKEIMRKEGITGMPICSNENKVIGIISLEDIIKALEKAETHKNLSELPKKNVVCFKEKDSFETINKYLSQYSFGRFPVVDNDNILKGIITKQDILTEVISKLSTLYFHDERRREVLDSDRSVLIKESSKEQSSNFTYDINTSDVNNAGEGSALLKKFLKNKKYDKKLVRNISIATYEAEVNVVIHGGGQGKISAGLEKDSINIMIEDTGPGIESVEKALVPGFSTAPDYIRGLGFGAGMGLPNIKRFADKLVITSEKNKGVNMGMVFWLK